LNLLKRKDPEEAAKKTMDFQTTKVERFVYPLYGMGQNLLLTFVSGYLMLFYTDVLVIPAVAISAIMFISRVWDAVNDPLFGYIVDRTTFKSGNKFMPWMKVSSLLIPVATLLIFLIPSTLSMPWKITFAFLTYFFWDLAYTISDVPLLSTLTALTGNANERTTIIGYNGVVGIPGTIILNVLLVPRLESWGFPTIAAIICVCSLACLVWLPRVGKERNREHIKTAPEVTFRDMFRYLKGNKYLQNFFFLSIAYGSLSIPFTNYILIQVFGGLEPVAVFTLIALPLTLVIFVLLPRLIRTVEKVWVFRLCYLGAVVSGLMSYVFARDSVAVYGVFFVLRSLFILSAVMMLLTFATDYVEYGHFKTGTRREGITFSIQTFSTKFVAAISGALGALILGWIHYDGALEVQAAETIDLLWTTGHLIPSLGLILAIPLVFRCNLWSKDAQIMADVNAGKLDREEGEAQLSRKY